MGQSRLDENVEEIFHSSFSGFPRPLKLFSSTVHSKTFETSLMQNIP